MTDLVDPIASWVAIVIGGATALRVGWLVTRATWSNNSDSSVRQMHAALVTLVIGGGLAILAALVAKAGLLTRATIALATTAPASVWFSLGGAAAAIAVAGTLYLTARNRKQRRS